MVAEKPAVMSEDGSSKIRTLARELERLTWYIGHNSSRRDKLKAPAAMLTTATRMLNDVLADEDKANT